MPQPPDSWDVDHHYSVAKLCARAACLGGVVIGWIVSHSPVGMIIGGAVSWSLGYIGGRALARQLAARTSRSQPPESPLGL